MEYLYDGTFDGLLTCLYEHVYTEKADDIRVPEENVQLSLGRQMQVKTDLTKSEKVAKAIEKKISPAALRRAYRAYLTAEKGKDVLYAAIHPNCDLIQSIMPHFLNRFRQDPFIIHDVGREKAGFAKDDEWVMRPLPRDFSPQYTVDEQQYRDLWKNYFRTAAIDQRRNPKLQKQFIPTRYWQYLTEMQ